MIYLKWLCFTLVDYLLLIPFMVAVVPASLFTKNGWKYAPWASTEPNPPQGDRGWIRERSPYPQVIDGWKGYINRVAWLWRNPNYPLQKLLAIFHSPKSVVVLKGNPNVSDKYAKRGWYFARCYVGKKLTGFEFYCVIPWGKPAWKRCLRARLGWKIMTDKFEKTGLAQLVNTFNPVKTFGESV